MSETPLPTPRHFLTTLLNRLSTIPLEPPQPPSAAINQTQPPNNALSRIPLAHRHLVITLHVLFPNLLLPALDLLDRGLVQKLTLSLSNPNPATTQPPPPPPINKIKLEDPPQLPQPTGNNEENNVRNKPSEENKGSIYVVYSTTTATPSRKRKTTTTTTTTTTTLPKPDPDNESPLSVEREKNTQKYLVHLQAWNCTCAAFAFSTVQSLLDSSPSPPPPLPNDLLLPEQQQPGASEAQPGQEQQDWEFGGLSTDGKGPNGGQVPMCKHLLACLLAERWDNALGGYVTSKGVGKGEMAGVVADV
ncbi:hypothetical protein QBC41DRAFT_125157 [Cercophora samala]|uniref:SWIM-type domain-containing protein n=1 Tax=Cercophora samala TaxID=330535 RepID=A0AA39ZLR9_9PEZI|nr:hypothetical protein QBC41DRAFT_125157 [Cercophora samala]